MKKSKFTDEELSQIRTMWSIDCEEIQRLSTNEICKIHKIKHDRLPDLDTWNEFQSLYPNATLQAWADAFFVSREAIRQLNSKHATHNIKTKKDEKQKVLVDPLYGSKPVIDLFELIIELYVKYPSKSLNQILEFTGVTKSYFNFWIDKDKKLNQKHSEAVLKRNENRESPEFLKCYRCKTPKLIDEFGNDKSTISGKNHICKRCNRKKEILEERLKNKNISEKKCSICGTRKHIARFTYITKEEKVISNYCFSCRGKRIDSRMRKKIIDAGISSNDANCILCNSTFGIEDFYFIRTYPRSGLQKAFLSKECRRCVQNKLKEFPSMRDAIMFGWKHQLMKIGVENYLEFSKYLNDYLNSVRKELL